MGVSGKLAKRCCSSVTDSQLHFLCAGPSDTWPSLKRPGEGTDCFKGCGVHGPRGKARPLYRPLPTPMALASSGEEGCPECKLASLAPCPSPCVALSAPKAWGATSLALPQPGSPCTRAAALHQLHTTHTMSAWPSQDPWDPWLWEGHSSKAVTPPQIHLLAKSIPRHQGEGHERNGWLSFQCSRSRGKEGQGHRNQKNKTSS